MLSPCWFRVHLCRAGPAKACRPARSYRLTIISSRPGFSRLDLVVVVLLGLTLLGFILVFLPRQRAHGLRVQCLNNLKITGEGIHSFHKEHDALPPARIADGYATWAVLLAPHVGREHPLQKWDLEKRFVDQEENTRRTPMLMYFCPARNRPAAVGADGALGDYAGVAGNGDPKRDWTGPTANGALFLAEVVEKQDDRIKRWRGRVSFQSLKRGLGYTLIVGEKHVPADHFGDLAQGDGSLFDGRHPANFSRVGGRGFGLATSPAAPVNNNFGSAHRGLCQFLAADGSARTFSVTTNPDVLSELCTRGE